MGNCVLPGHGARSEMPASRKVSWYIMIETSVVLNTPGISLQNSVSLAVISLLGGPGPAQEEAIENVFLHGMVKVDKGPAPAPSAYCPVNQPAADAEVERDTYYHTLFKAPERV